VRQSLQSIWRFGYIVGPKETPYEGGKFKLNIRSYINCSFCKVAVIKQSATVIENRPNTSLFGGFAREKSFLKVAVLYLRAKRKN